MRCGGCKRCYNPVGDETRMKSIDLCNLKSKSCRGEFLLDNSCLDVTRIELEMQQKELNAESDR